jgi:DNA-binding transcriptional MerR regulator
MADLGNGQSGYGIGTVAHLTGLDPHTIRAWERRYDAVRPQRTPGGSRRYGDTDVARLQLMKALTECGEPIRLAASFSDDELRTRLAKLTGVAAAVPAANGALRPPARVRTAVLEPKLAAQLEASGSGLGGLDVCLVAEDRASFTEALRLRPCDALVVSLASLGSDPLAAFEACLEASKARLAVVVYDFARRGVLAKLSRAGAKLVRGPLRVDQLRQALLDLVVIEEARRQHRAPRLRNVAPDVAPKRRFSDTQLARLAETATSVDCECPNHLSSLVSSLVAFETYSQSCESRDAADAALHAHLTQGTGRARAVLEELLADLCEHDGISV